MVLAGCDRAASSPGDIPPGGESGRLLSSELISSVTVPESILGIVERILSSDGLDSSVKIPAKELLDGFSLLFDDDGVAQAGGAPGRQWVLNMSSLTGGDYHIFN